MNKLYNPDLQHRRSIRLQGYDYTRVGVYFVTICTFNRQCLFGDVLDGEMRLNAYGQIVEMEWLRTAMLRPNVELDAFVIMPNHVHGIVVIVGDSRARPVVAGVGARRASSLRADHPTPRPAGASPRSLGAIVGSFKSAVTKRINHLRGTPGALLWQRNYYERIIRNEDDLDQVCQYIVNNPACWTDDENNLDNMPV